jgi:DNA-binding MarR family transcriptional regulator
MTNSEIRRKIIELLYERFKEHPYHRITPKEFREVLHIDLKTLYYNIIYLEEKGYIELQKPLEGSLFVGARITTKGIDLIEDEYQFNIVYPVARPKRTARRDFLQKFYRLIKKIESIDTINNDTKELIIEELIEIKNELKKPEPSYSKVKLLVEKIKEKNSALGTQVMAIIENPVIANKLRHSLKKDL